MCLSASVCCVCVCLQCISMRFWLVSVGQSNTSNNNNNNNNKNHNKNNNEHNISCPSAASENFCWFLAFEVVWLITETLRYTNCCLLFCAQHSIKSFMRAAVAVATASPRSALLQQLIRLSFTHTHRDTYALTHTQNVDKLFQAYLPFFLFLSSAMVSHIKLCIGPRFASFLVSISPHFASPRLAFLALPLRLPCALIKLRAEINSYVSLANSGDGEYMRFGFRFLFFWYFLSDFLYESARQVFRFSTAWIYTRWLRHLVPKNRNRYKQLSYFSFFYLSFLQLITRTIPTTSAPGRIWHVTSRQQRQQLWTLAAAMAAERRRSCAAARVRRFMVSWYL